MTISKITNKAYEPSECVFISNPTQCFKYFQLLGTEFFVDILYDGGKRENSLVFVWKRCPETAKAKQMWDNHTL